jgi:hypothetical protein
VGRGGRRLKSRGRSPVANRRVLHHLLLVVFVVDLADERLENVLERDDALCPNGRSNMDMDM